MCCNFPTHNFTFGRYATIGDQCRNYACVRYHVARGFCVQTCGCWSCVRATKSRIERVRRDAVLGIRDANGASHCIFILLCDIRPWLLVSNIKPDLPHVCVPVHIGGKSHNQNLLRRRYILYTTHLYCYNKAMFWAYCEIWHTPVKMYFFGRSQIENNSFFQLLWQVQKRQI
jgi:hypothetical protein